MTMTSQHFKMTMYIKMNSDGSLIDDIEACGDIFCEYKGSLLGCFTSNMRPSSAIEAELNNFILSLKYVGLMFR